MKKLIFTLIAAVCTVQAVQHTGIAGTPLSRILSNDSKVPLIIIFHKINWKKTTDKHIELEPIPTGSFQSVNQRLKHGYGVIIPTGTEIIEVAEHNQGSIQDKDGNSFEYYRFYFEPNKQSLGTNISKCDKGLCLEQSFPAEDRGEPVEETLEPAIRAPLKTKVQQVKSLL